MLVDLTDDWPRPAWLTGPWEGASAADTSEFKEVAKKMLNGFRRVAPGVYETSGMFDHVIEECIDVADPFDSDRRRIWKEMEKNTPGTPEHRALRDKLIDTPDDYGICDNWEQIIYHYPEIQSDPRPFLIYTMVITRNPGETGGWRWHKWGEYIGTHVPQHEYLDDEEDIEQVLVWALVQLKPQYISTSV